jgi:tetratricopeptide (TPR) repeat protein
MGQGFVHWEIAGFLLDQVVPSPGADAMVRDFYRATIAYLQRERKYEDGYLEHALKLFPEDATLLFLSGCQHEAFASPPIQSVARSVSLPYGVTLGVESPGVERRRAENFFRRALDVDPGFIEARLRRGRVLGLLGRHTEAAGELQQVIHTTEDPLLQYYAELFMGAEREALGQFDAARDSYERAADLNAGAQAPHLALSQLARRTGNRTAALRALRQVFDVGSSAGGADDPWWTYSVTAGRNAGDVLEALWRPFRKELSEQR